MKDQVENMKKTHWTEAFKAAGGKPLTYIHWSHFIQIGKEKAYKYVI